MSTMAKIIKVEYLIPKEASFASWKRGITRASTDLADGAILNSPGYAQLSAAGAWISFDFFCRRNYCFSSHDFELFFFLTDAKRYILRAYTNSGQSTKFI